MKCYLFVLFLAFKSDAQSSNEFDERLANLLRPLREISLHLRADAIASNRFVQFFLTQNVCPVNVFSNSYTESCRNGNNAILAKTNELKDLLGNYSSRQGTQFFIAESAFEPNVVINIARAIWNRWGIFKNYYLTSESVYFYNPFAVVGPQMYGALHNATGYEDFQEIFKNLNGYQVRTYIFRSVYASLVYDNITGEISFAEGADAEVAYSIAKAMNCQLILQEPDGAFFGHRLENGSFVGSIGRSIRYETELTLTGFFVKDYLTRDIEFSATVYMDELCCYVSKAKRIPQSILPLFSLKLDMWIGYIGTTFLWALIWSILRKVNLCLLPKATEQRTITQNNQYFRIFTDTWVVWVRVNISRYPPFSSEKIFVISLCLVSVIFGAIFESNLATVYINPLYYKDITTLQELDESQLKIYIKHAAMKDDLFYGSESPMFKRLKNKLLYIFEMEDRVIKMMSHRGGFASVTRGSSLMIDDISYILSKKIHKIVECPKNYHIAYALPKDSPFRQRVDDLLLQFLNGGLINYWIEMMYHKARIGILKSPEILKVMGGNKWKVLTIEDLQLAFYVVILGTILATVALIFEIFTAMWLRWRRTTAGLQMARNK